MNNIHRPHRTARIIENPLLIQIYIAAWVVLAQLRDNITDNRACVILMRSDSALGQFIEAVWGEDVELLEVAVEGVEERGESGEEDGEGCAERGHRGGRGRKEIGKGV